MSRPNRFGQSFVNVQKNENDTGQLQFLSWTEDTKLLLAPPHDCVTNLHVFFFNLVQVSAAHISVFLSILGGTITPTWVANAFVVSTNVLLLLCYARSCFLQQEISTFWPDSSKNMLLCPLILEGGPISNVYHLLLLSLPQIILVQHFAKVPSSLDWKEIFRSHFWKYLVCIAIIVCS